MVYVATILHYYVMNVISTIIPALLKRDLNV
jgi:hypothetical protein